MMTFVLQNGWSPLNAASDNGHLDVVKTLLEAGANINQATQDGRTSLDLAVERGHNETIQLLKTYPNKLHLTHEAQLANERARIAEERATRVEQELSETKLHYEALLQQADEKAKRADKRANQELLETKQHYDALQQQIRLQVQLSEERATRAEQELLEIKRQRDAMQQQTRLQVQNADERARRAEERATTAEKEHLETKQQRDAMQQQMRLQVQRADERARRAEERARTAEKEHLETKQQRDAMQQQMRLQVQQADERAARAEQQIPDYMKSSWRVERDEIEETGEEPLGVGGWGEMWPVVSTTSRPDPIIHRDVSSANVLLEPIGPGNWKAKVSDYGSANFLSKVRTMGPGNASYAAPESFNPKLQSPKMDVYSYGILLLEMATGQFPDHKLQAMQLDTLPWQEMAMMIRRCICDDPANRPTMKDLLPDLTDLDK
eukprot:Em0007g879a